MLHVCGMRWCQGEPTEEGVALTEVQKDVEERYEEGPSSDACCSCDRANLRAGCHLRCVDACGRRHTGSNEHSQDMMIG